jgi:hypothetical protein
MKHIAIPQGVATTYWHHTFAELETLASDGVDGICDADATDRMLWKKTADAGDTYDGVRSPGGRKRMHGYAILYRGDERDYGRPDVAALLIQNW